MLIPLLNLHNRIEWRAALALTSLVCHIRASSSWRPKTRKRLLPGSSPSIPKTLTMPHLELGQDPSSIAISCAPGRNSQLPPSCSRAGATAPKKSLLLRRRRAPQIKSKPFSHLAQFIGRKNNTARNKGLASSPENQAHSQPLTPFTLPAPYKLSSSSGVYCRELYQQLNSCSSRIYWAHDHGSFTRSLVYLQLSIDREF